MVASFLFFPCLPAIGAVVPVGVYLVITIGAVGDIIGYLALLDWGATDMAKFHFRVVLGREVRYWLMPLGAIALRCRPFFHLEHTLPSRKVLKACSGHLVAIGLLLVVGVSGCGLCFGSVRQKQLLFRLVKLETDPLNKGTAQGEFPSGHAAEISLGIACYLMKPIPRIFNE